MFLYQLETRHEDRELKLLQGLTEHNDTHTKYKFFSVVHFKISFADKQIHLILMKSQE